MPQALKPVHSDGPTTYDWSQRTALYGALPKVPSLQDLGLLVFRGDQHPCIMAWAYLSLVWEITTIKRRSAPHDCYYPFALILS